MHFILLFLLALVAGPADAQKNCTKGIPCGNTCIASNKTCRIGAGSSKAPSQRTGAAKALPARSGGSSCLVAGITDGDTLRCKDGTRVRLLLIDTPEKNQDDFGLRAKLALEELVPAGSSVRLEFDVQKTDRYGRTLAHVHAPNGAWVNLELVRRGYALVGVYPPNVRYVEQFREVAAEARAAGRGLWGLGGFDCSPADYRRGRC